MPPSQGSHGETALILGGALDACLRRSFDTHDRSATASPERSAILHHDQLVWLHVTRMCEACGVSSSNDRHRERVAGLEHKLRSGDWLPAEGDRQAAIAVIEFLRTEPPEAAASGIPDVKWRTDRLVLLHALLSSLGEYRVASDAPSQELRALLNGLKYYIATEFDNYRSAKECDHRTLCQFGSHQRRVDEAENLVIMYAEVFASVASFDID